jgi:ferredoxin
MIRIQVDRQKCMGHARCAMMAPDVYQLDENGYVDIPDGTVLPDGQRALALEGAAACPERALSVVRE